MRDNNRTLVYSTDGSLPLPKSERKRPVAPATHAKLPPSDGTVRVGCERRRTGSMTLIYGLPATQIVSIAKDLKRACGTGGTVKEGIVELQGDHRDAVLAAFAQQGRKAKRMGG